MGDAQAFTFTRIIVLLAFLQKSLQQGCVNLGHDTDCEVFKAQGDCDPNDGWYSFMFEECRKKCDLCNIFRPERCGCSFPCHSSCTYYPCHCKNNDACDQTTGECRAGCDNGNRRGYIWKGDWSGPGCQIGNVAYGRSTVSDRRGYESQSPRNSEYRNGSLAVDGILNPDPDAGHCSLAINADGYTSWQVDLGQDHVIKYVYIIYRNGGAGRISSSKVVLLDEHGSEVGECDRIGSGYQSTYNQSCAAVTRPARHVKIQRMYSTLKRLELCEVMVFGYLYHECGNGSYGPGCLTECNHCKVPCDAVTGVCPAGSCEQGWWGPRCGEQCNSPHCQVQCDAVTGVCPPGSCEQGWRGPQCYQACQTGYYGRNCASSCGNCVDGATCDHVTGACDACAAGWTGERCDAACQTGYYGWNCESSCGNCVDGTTCDHVTGACDACAASWKGERCDAEGYQTYVGEQYVLVCPYVMESVIHSIRWYKERYLGVTPGTDWHSFASYMEQNDSVDVSMSLSYTDRGVRLLRPEGSLHFPEILLSDEGYYTCTVDTGAHYHGVHLSVEDRTHATMITVIITISGVVIIIIVIIVITLTAVKRRKRSGEIRDHSSHPHTLPASENGRPETDPTNHDDVPHAYEDIPDLPHEYLTLNWSGELRDHASITYNKPAAGNGSHVTDPTSYDEVQQVYEEISDQPHEYLTMTGSSDKGVSSEYVDMSMGATADYQNANQSKLVAADCVYYNTTEDPGVNELYEKIAQPGPDLPHAYERLPAPGGLVNQSNLAKAGSNVYYNA